MGRPKMAPGSWGDITFRATADGSYIGRVSYRTLDGQRREVTASAPTKIGVDRKLKLKLPALIAAAAAPPAHAPVTFEMVVSEWLKFEELKLPDHLKARGTHAEHLRMLRRHLLPAFGEMGARLRRGVVRTGSHRVAIDSRATKF